MTAVHSGGSERSSISSLRGHIAILRAAVSLLNLLPLRQHRGHCRNFFRLFQSRPLADFHALVSPIFADYVERCIFGPRALAFGCTWGEQWISKERSHW